VCDQSNRDKQSIELADVFLRYGDSYIEQHGVSTPQDKAIRALSRCRTAALGGHVTCCTHCGIVKNNYNSCRNRHCPKCQTTKQLRWLESRKSELLPVGYFHVVFTIPHELNSIASYNQALIYNLLFKAAWTAVCTLGQNNKEFDGLMGMLAFLHTWGQNLSQHIHLHCMIPGGALRDIDGQKKWKSSKPDYLFSVKVMARFTGKVFIRLLQEAYKKNEIIFNGSITDLEKPEKFAQFIALLRKKNWNVYAKEPFNGAEGGLEYLGRYVSKTAIGNERILSYDNQQVTFKWRDYADESKEKVMVLDAHEFIRRYLQHVLPNGFMRIRAFGFLANACKTKNIELIRSQLIPSQKDNDSKQEKKSKEPIDELMMRLTGIDINLCQHCKIGRLETIGTILSQWELNLIAAQPQYIDTS
jgi:Putative transposase/Transposase zinc-binding domain